MERMRLNMHFKLSLWQTHEYGMICWLRLIDFVSQEMERGYLPIKKKRCILKEYHRTIFCSKNIILPGIKNTCRDSHVLNRELRNRQLKLCQCDVLIIKLMVREFVFFTNNFTILQFFH